MRTFPQGFFAGTDAEVHLELVDEKGEAWEPLLVQTKAMFEAGATDEFIVACPKQLGAIKTVRAPAPCGADQCIGNTSPDS